MGTESLPPQGSPSTYLQVEGSVPALHVLLWGQQEDAAEAGLQESVLSFTLHNQLGSAAKAEGPVGCWARQWSCNARACGCRSQGQETLRCYGEWVGERWGGTSSPCDARPGTDDSPSWWGLTPSPNPASSWGKSSEALGSPKGPSALPPAPLMRPEQGRAEAQQTAPLDCSQHGQCLRPAPAPSGPYWVTLAMPGAGAGTSWRRW